MAGESTGSYTTTGGGGGGFGRETRRNGRMSRPIDTKTKSITYSTDTPDLLLDLNETSSVSAAKTGKIDSLLDNM